MGERKLLAVLIVAALLVENVILVLLWEKHLYAKHFFPRDSPRAFVTSLQGKQPEITLFLQGKEPIPITGEGEAGRFLDAFAVATSIGPIVKRELRSPRDYFVVENGERVTIAMDLLEPDHMVLFYFRGYRYLSANLFIHIREATEDVPE